ncbi:MAG: UbiA family prenyltransferase [Phycisphaerae bacterium]|jgi:hypothetical protein
MVQNQDQQGGIGWLEASGLRSIIGTLRAACQPSKLVLGLFGIFLTFVLGGVLDLIWSQHQVGEAAITQFIQARQMDRTHEDPEGTYGIFEVWRTHQKRCVLGVLGSSIPGTSVIGGTILGNYLETHADTRPLHNVVGMVYGVWWLVRHHFLYFLLFAIGFLLIWSWCGGAMCRMDAVRLARGEPVPIREALEFSRQKLFGGFFLAPVIPIGFILLTTVVMILGGMVFRIPILGDVLCGLGFGLAILGGFLIAVLLVGLAIGGHLLWPAVAVEGSDAFDAFQRGIYYPLSKPWKWLLYTVIAIVYAAICWVIVNLFTYLALLITRFVVSVGAAWFGWWPNGTEEAPINKMAMLWPFAGPEAMHAWPAFEGLAWWEYISVVLVGVWVLITIGLLWSFLISLYFSNSTVIYLLLRRDVDDVDTDEIYIEEDDATGESSPPFGAPPAAEDSPEASSPAQNPDSAEENPRSESTGEA